MKARIAVALGCMMISIGAMASTGGDGNELLTQCQNAVKAMDGAKVADHYDVGYCLGLTQGVRQAMRLYNDDIPAKERVCFPAGITNGQGVRIVTKFLQEHPEKLQEPATNLVYLAYIVAYSCE